MFVENGKSRSSYEVEITKVDYMTAETNVGNG